MSLRKRTASGFSSVTYSDSTSFLRLSIARHWTVTQLLGTLKSSRMVGLDAPRQLDMTLEVRTQRSTGDVLRASIRMVAQGKLSPETQERIRPFGFLPKAAARSAEDAPNPSNIDHS